MKGSDNKRLSRAIANRNDEFYTMFEEIEKEVAKEVENLREGCHFWNYFYENFEHLELKKLITTHYLPSELKKRTRKLGYSGRRGGGVVHVCEYSQLRKQDDMDG